MHCYDKGLANLDASDVGKRTRLLNEIAWIYIRQAEYEQARELCKRVVELAGPDSANLATAYDYMGVACRFQGDYTSAAECHQTSLALWEKVGDETQIAKELNNLGNLAELSHSYSEAIDYYQRSLVLCKEVGSSLGIAFLLNNLGVIYTGLGQMDRAYDHLQESLGIFQRIGSKEGIAIVYNNLAEIHVRQNEPQQAMDCLRRVEAILDDGSDKSTRVYMLLLMAETELLQQRLNEAEHDARRALDMIVESGMKVYEGRAQAVLGEICTQSGRSASAREHLLKASEIFETNRQLADLEQIRDWLQQLDAAAQAS